VNQSPHGHKGQRGEKQTSFEGSHASWEGAPFSRASASSSLDSELSRSAGSSSSSESGTSSSGTTVVSVTGLEKVEIVTGLEKVEHTMLKFGCGVCLSPQ
jgi:hypothetical protein